MDVTDRSGSDTAQVPERRHGERRSRILLGVIYGGFRPRRRGPRRAGERSLSALDWHHPQWLAISMLIVLMSCLDAFLTLVLIGRGDAREANPIMAPLVDGSAMGFAIVKIGLTAGGVILLTHLARLRAFGRIPVGLLLYGVLAVYCALIAYEFTLLNAA